MTFPQRGNVRMLFDPIEEIELDDVLARADNFRYRKRMLLQRIADPPRVLQSPYPCWRLFGRWIDVLFYREVNARITGYFALPWGWRMEHALDRDCLRMMPTWLYWLRNTRELYWLAARTLVRLGFLQGKEGDFFANHDWSWRVWQSRYSTLLLKYPENPPSYWLPYRSWYAFWRWFRADWDERMPPTATELDVLNQQKGLSIRQWRALLDSEYVQRKIVEAMNATSPFVRLS